MAAASLLALLDDIATVLDDVATLTQLAARKTAGVLGDDLAVNAEQVAGVRAERELPVVWAVAKGSLVNKAILVPAALLIAAVLPQAITPLLMVGGAFLCFEGVEKLLHRPEPAEQAALHQAVLNPQTDMVALERDKIRGAVRTDFVLSAEIIAITLGAVAGAPLGTQLAVLVATAVLITVGVYGLVALIVKLDDMGLALSRRGGLARGLGQLLLQAAPGLMKALSVLGTAAMFVVGGGILVHGLPALHHLGEALTAGLGGGWLGGAAGLLFDALLGVVCGAVVLAGVHGVTRWRAGRRA